MKLPSVVNDKEGILSIKPDAAAGMMGADPEYYLFRVSAATRVGGKYSLNQDLLKAADAEFISVANRMEMRVEPENLEATLKVLMQDQGIQLVVNQDAHKAIARNYLGQTLPTLETVESPAPETDQTLSSPPQVESAQQLGMDFSVNLAPPVQRSASPTQNLTTPASPPLPDGVEPEGPDHGSTEIPPTAKDCAEPKPDSVQDMILASSEQTGRPEKNIAKLLHQAGLETSLLQGESFHLKIENEPFMPLVIERQLDQLSLTHYWEESGEQIMDAEMVFNIDRGHLSLAETATFNPGNGGESRNLDRSFATVFSRNLNQQGFAQAVQAIQPQAPKLEAASPQPTVEATLEAFSQPQEETAPSIQTNRKNIEVTPTNWPIVAQALERSPEYVTWVEQVSQQPQMQPQVAAKMSEDFSQHEQTLNRLRQWYRTAESLDKSEAYSGRIHAVAEEFKSGQPLLEKAMRALKRDFCESAYNRLSKGLDRSNPTVFIRTVAKRGLEQGITPKQLVGVMLFDEVVKQIHRINPKTATDFVKQAIVEGNKLLPPTTRVKLSQPTHKRGGIER